MKLTVGILTHNSEKFAQRSLETLVAQTGLGALGKDWMIVSLDNASKNRIELARLEKKFPRVRFIKEEMNLGFGRAHNLIMRTFPAEFHAVLNVDVLFSPNFLSVLLHALEKNTRYGSAVGKLLRWDIGEDPEKTSIIDSVGIGVTKDHAFFDIGQGKRDKGEYEKEEERFGGSGAAVVYRRSALEDIAYRSSPPPSPPTEFFDETMFMYKEDVDLSYRFLVKGHLCLYVPDAVAWHARGVSKRASRQKRSHAERAWSAAHEKLLLKKHKEWWPESIRRATDIRQCLRSLYMLIFEPTAFFRMRRLLKDLEPEAAKRRKAVTRTVSFQEIAHLFQ